MLNRSWSVVPGRGGADERIGGVAAVVAEPRHFRSARPIVASAPVTNVHIGALLPAPTSMRRPAGAHWALLDGPRTIGLIQRHRGLCWAVAPAHRDDPRVATAIARLVARQLRFSEVLHGPAAEVQAVVERCQELGVGASELRRQQMMACSAPREAAAWAPDDGFRLRAALHQDLRWILAAHGAMCFEDLGADQVARNPAGYARFFTELIRARRAFVGEQGGHPVFKADVALESREAWLIEGVYTAPEARGRGCATRAMAWLADMARAKGCLACLYVNCRNQGAIRVYERVGFEVVCPWATAVVTRTGRRPLSMVEF